MPVLRLFAAAREAAGEARVEVEGATVGDVLEAARQRYGEPFVSVLQRCRVWLNGQPADDAMLLEGHDVVAVLPPVSGGAGASAGTSVGPAPPVAPAAPPPAAPPPRAAPSAPPAPPAAPMRPPAAAPGPPPMRPPAAAPGPPPMRPTAAAPGPPPMRPPAAAPGPPPMRPTPSPAPIVPAWSPPPAPVPPPALPSESFDEPSPEPPSWPEARRAEEWSWAPERGMEPLPPIEGATPDDVLDRLAGLAPRRDDEDLAREPFPPAPPAWAPPESPADELGADELPADDPDALWGPPSGPVWSLGEAEPSPSAEPLEFDWEEDRPHAPGERTDERIESSPGPSPAGPSPAGPSPAQAPHDWDRRWDAPLAEPDPGDDGGGPQARLSDAGPVAPARSPRRIVEPTVRILGPEPFARPGRAVDVTDPPPLTVLGRGETAGQPNGSPERRGGMLLVDQPTRPYVPEIGKAAGGLHAAPPPVPPVALAAVASPAPAAGPATAAAPAVAPTVAPAAKPRQKPPPLAVVPKSTRPHGRLGFLWVGITVVTVVAGVTPAAVWLALCAGIAGLQTARVWRGRSERPLVALAGATAAALPLCAISGPRAMTAAVAVAVVVTLLARLFSLTKAPARDVGLTLAIGVVIGLAVASVVLLRQIDNHAPLLLLSFAAAYDAGAYLVGTGASSAWEGPVAGVATLIPVTMLSAVILVPPFPEGSPLLLGLIAAVLAPCGPLAGSALLGERDASASALRRLDSLLVMAPVWAWCAAAFLR